MMDIDLNQVLNMLGIKAESKGDRYVAKCPIHSEKTASWGISKDYPHLWHCFGCGAGGNIYSLVRRLTQRSLTDFLGISDVSSFEFSNSLRRNEAPKLEKRNRLTIKGELKDPYTNSLVSNYLESRGVDRDFIEYFNISYVDYATINETKIYNRILIPVIFKNRFINVECRDFTKRSKLKVIYPRGGISDTLFNYDRLDFSKSIYCVEGIFDLPKLFALGERNITCTFGAALGSKQEKLLSTIKNLVWLPDNDDAGRNVLENLDEIMNEEWSIAFVPNNRKDPGDCTPEEIKEAITNRIEANTYLSEKHLGRKTFLSW